MSVIIFFLLISQEPIGRFIQDYDINDFPYPLIASENIEYACWNPAAISDIKTFSFASGVVYTSGKLDLSSFFGEDFNYKTSEFLPEFLGISFPLNKTISLGFSFSIPYKSSYTRPWVPVLAPPTEDSSKISSALRFYAFNPIISYKLKENLTIGINPGILVKKYNAYLEYNSPDSSKRELANGKYFGIEPNLGLQYQLNKALRFDASIKKGFVQGKETSTTVEYSVKEILPLIASIGTKINITPELSINNAIDFIHWKGKCLYVDGEKEFSGEIRNVFRIHLGGEYKIKSKYALRLGIYNDPYKSSSSFAERDQIFLIGGIGAEFGKLKINVAASSSNLIATEEKETTNFHLSIAY